MPEFKPVRLTHPSGKHEDIVATSATEYSDFLYRDGYVVSKDQRPLGSEDAPAATSETVVESTASATKSKDRSAGRNTNEAGKSVTTE